MAKAKEGAALKEEALGRFAREARKKALNRSEALIKRRELRGGREREDRLKLRRGEGSPLGLNCSTKRSQRRRGELSHGEKRREEREAPRAPPRPRLEPKGRAKERRGSPRALERRERPLFAKRRRSEARRDQRLGARAP